eukprot:76486_1
MWCVPMFFNPFASKVIVSIQFFLLFGFNPTHDPEWFAAHAIDIIDKLQNGLICFNLRHEVHILVPVQPDDHAGSCRIVINLQKIHSERFLVAYSSYIWQSLYPGAFALSKLNFL